MENLLLKIEVFFLFSSFMYILYYIFDYIKNIFWKVKKIVWPVNTEEQKEVEIVKINKDDVDAKDLIINDSSEKSINTDDKVKISEILKRVKLNIEKWYYDKAKSLIIEWLTIDKYNKELNLELWKIYENEENYKNAELIYKDLSLIIQDNSNILTKLAYVYSMQWEYSQAIKTYEIVHRKKQADSEIIESLAYLSFEIDDHERSLKYFKMALKEKPKNVEMLKRKAISLEKTKKLRDSAKVYEEILFLRPYDEEAKENLSRLEKYIVDWK